MDESDEIKYLYRPLVADLHKDLGQLLQSKDPSLTDEQAEAKVQALSQEEFDNLFEELMAT